MIPSDALPVSRAPRYRVTSDGRVYRVDGRQMVPQSVPPPKYAGNNTEYLRVSLTLTGPPRARKCWYVHVLVAEAFIGPKLPGMDVNHINGDKSDNRVENLEYVTRGENVRHSVTVLGAKRARGEGHPAAKATESIVREMRQLYASGATQAELARRYATSLSRAQVRKIVSGCYWRHVVPGEVA